MIAKLTKKACIAFLSAAAPILLSLPAQSQKTSRRVPIQLVLDGKLRTVYHLGYINTNLRPRRISLPGQGMVYNGIDRLQSFIAEPGEITIRGYSYPFDSKTNTPYKNHTDPKIINVHILYGRNFKCSFVLHKPPQQNRRCVVPSKQRVYVGKWLKRVGKPVRSPLNLRDVVIYSGPAAKNLYKMSYTKYRADELAVLRAGGGRIHGGGTGGNKCVGSAFNGC